MRIMEEASQVENFQIHVSDGMFVTAADLDTLNAQINTVSLKYWESVSKKMTIFFEPLALPSSGETDIHAVVKKHVKELIVAVASRGPRIAISPLTFHCRLA